MSGDDPEERERTAPSAALVRAATVVLAGTGLVASAALALALSRVRPGLGVDQLLVYYLAPTGVLVCVGLVLLRGRAGTRVAFGLLIATFALTLLAAETVATLVLRAQDQRARILLVGASIAEQAQALRDQGVRAYATVPGNVLVDLDVTLSVDSVLTHPMTTAPDHVTAVLCSERGITVTFESDRYGFNNPDDAWEGAADVLLVGDSFTQGVCVPEKDQIAGVLRDRFRVVNLGNKGAGPIQELATVREYGALTEATDVFWIYFEGNDRYDLARERGRPWLMAYLDPAHGQSLAERREAVGLRYAEWIDGLLAAGPTPAGAEAPRGPLSDVLRFRSLRRLTRFGVLLPAASSPITILPQVLEQARDEVAGWGGRLHLVYLPSYERYATLVGEGVPGKYETLAAAEALGIPVVDLDPDFRRTGRPREMWTDPGGHLTPEGYRTVADAIRRSLPSGSGMQDP